MKTTVLFTGLLLALTLAGCAAPAPEPEPFALETDDDKTLYAMGLVISRNLASLQFSEDELAKIQAGIEDGSLGREAQVEIQTFGPKIDGMIQARLQEVAAAQRAEGEAMVAAAAGEAGAETLPTGMVYKEITPGNGASPAADETVVIHYTGSLADGSVFDDSRKGDPEPVTFNLGRVIPCFRDGILKMKVGGTSKLTCPTDLAYGDRGSPPAVPPGASLSFEVELVEIASTGNP